MLGALASEAIAWALVASRLLRLEREELDGKTMVVRIKRKSAV
jgi:hypothetical protein